MGDAAEYSIQGMMNPNYGRIQRQAYKRNNPMFQMQGIVQAVSNQQKFYQTKQGTCYNASFKMEDNQWYVIPFVNQGMPHPVQQGQQVSFQYEQSQNGQYTNNKVNPKSIQVQGGQQQQQSPQQQAPMLGPSTSKQAVIVPQQPPQQDDRQNQIMRQACMGYAAQLVARKCDQNTDLGAASRTVTILAERYFLQYAKTGKIPEEEQPQTQTESQQAPQQQMAPPQQANPLPQGHQAPDPFDDDIPF